MVTPAASWRRSPSVMTAVEFGVAVAGDAIQRTHLAVGHQMDMGVDQPGQDGGIRMVDHRPVLGKIGQSLLDPHNPAVVDENASRRRWRNARRRTSASLVSPACVVPTPGKTGQSTTPSSAMAWEVNRMSGSH